MSKPTDADRYEAIRRLLHIETSESGVAIGDLIAVAFVESALAFLPGDRPHSLQDVAEAIKDLFHLWFEPAELRHAI